MKLEMPPFQQARVLVVGDVMLDRYWHGKATRISPEAPVPVVHVESETLRLGGAANVFNNILALGGKADLCGVIGADESGRGVRAHDADGAQTLVGPGSGGTVHTACAAASGGYECYWSE